MKPLFSSVSDRRVRQCKNKERCPQLVIQCHVVSMKLYMYKVHYMDWADFIYILGTHTTTTIKENSTESNEFERKQRGQDRWQSLEGWKRNGK